MGEIAEMMIDGTLCQVCGEFMGGDCGFPRTCRDCAVSEGIAASLPRPQAQGKPRPHVTCPECGKRVKEAGLADHQRDVHAGT